MNKRSSINNPTTSKDNVITLCIVRVMYVNQVDTSISEGLDPTINLMHIHVIYSIATAQRLQGVQGGRGSPLVVCKTPRINLQ